MYPKIDSPCPLASIQLPAQGKFHCSSCHRDVHDLSAMSELERAEFLRSCEGKVCVSYRSKMNWKTIARHAAAGVFVVSASGIALPAAAALCDDTQDESVEFLVVGGVDNAQTAALEKGEVSETDAQDQLQLIPVVEEDDDSES